MNIQLRFRILTYSVCVLLGSTLSGLNAQPIKTLVTFPTGTYPGALIRDAKAGLFGITNNGGAYGFGSVYEYSLSGTLATLHSFRITDGAVPSSLVRGTDGNFYGTTVNGGSGGAGTVFKLTPSGAFTVLYSFPLVSSGAPITLIGGAGGTFYGATGQSVFAITSSGVFHTIYTLNALVDGSNVEALAQGYDGNLYGTTAYAGSQSPTGEAGGAIFKLSLQGSFSLLYVFSNTNAVGAQPNSLIQAADGNFYGTTFYGGSSDDGTIFRVTPAGALTNLHNFTPLDGDEPSGFLKISSAGNLYGTTLGGGSAGSPSFYGTVFQINTTGAFTLVYQFNATSGNGPNGIVEAPGGIYYGTTLYSDTLYALRSAS